MASIFEVTIEDVPQFSEMNEGEGRWHLALKGWLKERGWELICLDYEFCPEGFYLASGQSQRGVSHMVVMKDGSLAHDPHPSRCGIINVESVYLFLLSAKETHNDK